jgi:hypothetical protein
MTCKSSHDLTDGMSWQDRFQAGKNPNNGARPNSINRTTISNKLPFMNKFSYNFGCRPQRVIQI